MRFTPITFNTLVNPLRYNPGTRSINWFPGHMAKGIREIETRLKQIDVILEIRDCRIPLSSINPRFEQMIKNERMRNRDGSNDIQRVIVYNKRDLIEDKEVKVN
ncbi:hypothetical protein K502DRAFT_324557 [Neoconidiobolus thromboides FSU 785]|nr:hypothetical protein K502DRAFT_324557 [Neoconidiobolus thromboides FSU 785]